MSNDNAIHTESYRGCTIQIEQDFDPPNPRKQWSNLGELLCIHSRYSLGDEHDYRTPEDIQEYTNKTAAICLPLYLYDHGGMSISTRSFAGRAPHADWDSGMVGYAIVTRAAILKNYNCRRISRQVLGRAQMVLQAEIREYDLYLRGEIYGFEVSYPDGTADSCWGYFGESKGYVLECARQAIDEHLQYTEEEETRLLSRALAFSGC